MGALVEAKALHKSFGSIAAVDGISLSVGKGEVLGFLGPNGAGKSTTMKMITGFLEPDHGSTRICGFDMGSQALQAKARLGYLPEGAPLYAEMTPRDLLSFVAEIRGVARRERASRIGSAVDRTGLEDVLDQRIETLSKGFKRRVGIAQAILHDPLVLIMDEPTDGLDPNQKHHMRELISQMAAEKAIIVSTHILEEVDAVCTRAVIISNGRIVADGTADDLMRRVPYHGAVVVRVPAKSQETVIAALSKYAAIARIEPASTFEDQVDLRAIPADGAEIVTDVASLLHDNGIAVNALFVERGKLDDVFREITASEEETTNA